MKYFSLAFVVLLSCCTSKNGTMDNATNSSFRGLERFNEFYNLFKNDTVFRSSRTLNPFFVHLGDEVTDQIEEVNQFSKFPYDINEMAKELQLYQKVHTPFPDTTVMILGIEDTGYHLELFFFRSATDQKWYAFKAVDSST